MVVPVKATKSSKAVRLPALTHLKLTAASAPDSARIKADSALARHNEYQQNGSLTLTGTPQLTAGNKIELVGFGQLSGPWLIITARHAFERNSGYTTELEVARGQSQEGKNKNSETHGLSPGWQYIDGD